MAKPLSIRLFVSGVLKMGEDVICEKGQAHYLLSVLRLKEADQICVFNGLDGEWSAQLCREGKRGVRLRLLDQLQLQTPDYPLHYLFAPLKRARLDYMVQKAVELGVS